MRNTIQRHSAILTCCRFTWALCLPSDQWFWNLFCTYNNMIAKYIVLSNIITIAPDNILRICIQKLFLILKKLYFFFIPYQLFLKSYFLLHTYSSAIKFDLISLSDLRECLRTTWKYDEAYENFSINRSSTMLKESYKK